MKLTTPIALDEGRKMRSLSAIVAALVIFGCATASAQKAVPSHVANAVADPDALAQDALAQNDRHYSDGPVIEVDYMRVEYGHFAEYIDWLNSTWKPTMDAMKKAGLILDYKVFQALPKTPDQPNLYLWITYKNASAALDRGVELEYVARKVIGSTEFQNKKRVERTGIRKVMGNEIIRELILK